jgi:hypothetical protein
MAVGVGGLRPRGPPLPRYAPVPIISFSREEGNCKNCHHLEKRPWFNSLPMAGCPVPICQHPQYPPWQSPVLLLPTADWRAATTVLLRAVPTGVRARAWARDQITAGDARSVATRAFGERAHAWGDAK